MRRRENPNKRFFFVTAGREILPPAPPSPEGLALSHTRCPPGAPTAAPASPVPRRCPPSPLRPRPLPHCHIPQRVSSAVRAASLLLWSNNFAWARLFFFFFPRVGRKPLGSGAPPTFSFLLPFPPARRGGLRQPAVRGLRSPAPPSPAPGGGISPSASSPEVSLFPCLSEKAFVCGPGAGIERAGGLRPPPPGGSVASCEVSRFGLDLRWGLVGFGVGFCRSAEGRFAFVCVDEVGFLPCR